MDKEVSISLDAIEFIKKLLHLVRLDPMDAEFKQDAQAIIEIKEVLFEQA